MNRPANLVALACAAWTVALGSPLSAQATVGLEEEVDALFADWDNEASAGCAVAADQVGDRLLERAYGMANLEHGIPNSPETIFENGSVSKQFTAAAIVLLALDGKLSLEDDVREYVPEVPDYGYTITLRHLLNHTSGLRDWGSVAGISGWGRSTRTHTHEHVVDILSRQTRLNFEPGHEYSYSNSGYNLLAVVVTRVSGMPFAQFSKERIFEPLGMVDTQWRDDYTRIVPGRSVGYSPDGEGGYRINHPIENVHGNGGLLTTVDDLLTWNRSLNDSTLAGPEFVRMMETQGVLNDGRTISYALGLFVGENRGVRSVSHTGATSGYRAFLARYPDQELSVAVLCNASNANPGGLGGDVAELFLADALGPEPELPRGVELPDAELERRAGMYREVQTGQVVRLAVAAGGRLMRGRTELVPVSATEFHVGTSGQRAVFEPGRGQTGFRLMEGDIGVDAFEPVEAWEPTAAELRGLEGTFYSWDAETELRFTAAEGQLTIHRRPADEDALRPAYRDAFYGPMGFLRFVRDEGGEVLYVTLYQSRVYDMRFYPVPAGR